MQESFVKQIFAQVAYELTNLVHGEEEANKAREASHALFTGIGDDSNMPTTQLTENNVTQDGISIVDLLVLCKLATSKTEARRLILQGGIRVDGQKVDKRIISFSNYLSKTFLTRQPRLFFQNRLYFSS